MTMERNSRKDRFDSNSGNGRGSFEEHDERMREFRRSHADVAMVNAPRLDEAAFLESLRPLRVSRIMIETGGSALPNDTTDRSALVPMWKVARYKIWQN